VKNKPASDGRRRRRFAAIAAAAGAALVVVTAALSLHALQANGAAGSAPRAAEVCSVPAPDTAAGYAAALRGLTGAQWGAADLSVSVPLPDGRSVWLYADTLSGRDSSHLNRFVHSTAIVQDRGCLHLSDGGAQVIPDVSPTVFVWPAGAVALDATHVLVATEAIRATGSCPLCFEQVGARGAVLTVDDAGNVRFAHWTPAWPRWTGEIVWGTGLARQGDEVVMYGLSPAGISRDLYVATSTVDGAAAGRWRTDSTPVAHGVDPAGVTSYADDRGWHVVTLRGSSVVRMDGAGPRGPFAETVVASVPASTTKHMFYAAAAHPEARLRSGALLVTVCQNWFDGAARPLRAYRPLYLDVAG
jgi:hypothetical protein